MHGSPTSHLTSPRPANIRQQHPPATLQNATQPLTSLVGIHPTNQPSHHRCNATNTQAVAGTTRVHNDGVLSMSVHIMCTAETYTQRHGIQQGVGRAARRGDERGGERSAANTSTMRHTVTHITSSWQNPLHEGTVRQSGSKTHGGRMVGPKCGSESSTADRQQSGGQK
uniref:Uncharacterized protein n=1 Tax=Vitrella brassicaformis TaxID=1169539 RepID=A0A7S1KHG7_9ALVE|mmetsp:Transcript_6014/g.14411  ORF Transcript_6014/g.14411 Transcript_6014/m.14411 type:complete len:169 (+) Transcript_6014:59-565(+)